VLFVVAQVDVQTLKSIGELLEVENAISVLVKLANE
jgi:hypothetical protein